MSHSTPSSKVLTRSCAPLLACFALLVISGCGSKAPQTSAAAENSTAKRSASGEEWFCQVGATNDEWDCTKDSSRQAPTRLPQPRSSGSSITLDPAAASTQPPGVVPQSRPVTAPPSASTPVSPAPAPPPASSQAKPLALPRHVELSYRPDKPVAILDLPEDFFAVQLVAVSSKEALEKYAQERRLSGMSAARIYAADQMYYILLLGIYETQEKAELAIASLSGPLAELSPWIRSVGSLQSAMLEAERVSGTDNY